VHVGGAGTSSVQPCQDGSIGARCNEDNQCTSGACVSGTCEALGALGESCSKGNHCISSTCNTGNNRCRTP
jgi:hypothetical protein